LEDRSTMEDLALHRSALDHGALVAAEPVETRLQECLDRRRHGHVGVDAVLTHHRDHLFDEERITLRSVDDPRAHPRIELDLLEQLTHEKCTVSRRQRLEQERAGIQLAASPRWA